LNIICTAAQRNRTEHVNALQGHKYKKWDSTMSEGAFEWLKQMTDGREQDSKNCRACTWSDIGPAALVQLVRCFGFGLIRTVNELGDAFLGAT
jgi:hypothetical protein